MTDNVDERLQQSGIGELRAELAAERAKVQRVESLIDQFDCPSYPVLVSEVRAALTGEADHV